MQQSNLEINDLFLSPLNWLSRQSPESVSVVNYRERDAQLVMALFTTVTSRRTGY